MFVVFPEQVQQHKTTLLKRIFMQAHPHSHSAVQLWK